MGFKYRLLTVLFSLLFFACSQKKKIKHTNALINESSPYLLQHAHNPVNWHPWNSKYLKQAEKENKLVLLSIGYASCHWCHVMEKETFENEEVAKFMNENFINIKIDREEHPDVDKTYLTAVQLMTGNGGWPLNCIILPNGKPIWGGTYFPKKEWLTSLQNITSFYKKNPTEIDDLAERLTNDLKSLQIINTNDSTISFTNTKLKRIINDWKFQLDTINGGLKGNRQFPRPNSYQFLLRYAQQFQDTTLLNFVTKTLDKIASGGLNDHIEGGFARYTVDNKWHIPHFEKMLYDNAQLISLFSYGYQITKNPIYKDIVYATFDFLSKNFYTNGLYYSSLNADSVNEKNEMEEGAYYTWKKEDLKQLLGNDTSLFYDYYGITKVESIEGKHTLVKMYSDFEFSKKHRLKIEELKNKLNSWKDLILKERKKRIKPELDIKILTSWNALLLQAYTDAYKVFGDKHFKQKAIENATALKNEVIADNWKINRNVTQKDNPIKGYLEDYALVIKSYISLYQITLDEKWLLYANNLTTSVFSDFYDKEHNYFNFTSKENATLISNTVETEDIIMPSSNSVMCENLFLLGHYFDTKNYINTSKQMLHNLIPKIEKYPYSHSNWLNMYTNFSNPFYEMVVCGEDALKKTKEIHSKFLPNILLCGSLSESDLPLLKARYHEDKTLIYICVNKTCKLPTEDVNRAISLMKN